MFSMYCTAFLMELLISSVLWSGYSCLKRIKAWIVDEVHSLYSCSTTMSAKNSVGFSNWINKKETRVRLFQKPCDVIRSLWGLSSYFQPFLSTCRLPSSHTSIFTLHQEKINIKTLIMKQHYELSVFCMI